MTAPQPLALIDIGLTIEHIQRMIQFARELEEGNKIPHDTTPRNQPKHCDGITRPSAAYNTHSDRHHEPRSFVRAPPADRA